MRQTDNSGFNATFDLTLTAAFFATLIIVFVAIPETEAIASANQYRHEAAKLRAQYESSEGNDLSFSEVSGLDGYLAYAALHNPGLRSAYYKWIAQLKRAGYVGALPDPQLTYSYFIENVETRVGPQEQRIGLRQQFPWFGTLGSRKDIALESANAAYQKYRSLKLALFYRVKKTYFDYYYLGKQIQLTDDNIKLLKFWESVARTEYKAALRRYPDVLKAQVELGMLSDMLETLTARKEPVAARLRSALNLPSDTPIPLPTSIPYAETAVDREVILKLVSENNPDITSLFHQVERQLAAERLAGKASYPNLTLGVDYVGVGEAINPLLSESGKDSWSINVGLNLPIWPGKNKARKNEARAKLREARYALSEKENDIIEIAEQVLFRHEDALRKIRLYRDGLVPKAHQSLNAESTAYEAGETDFLNVLDAQRLLLDFELKLVLAVTELAQSQAELEALTGLAYEATGSNDGSTIDSGSDR